MALIDGGSRLREEKLTKAIYQRARTGGIEPCGLTRQMAAGAVPGPLLRGRHSSARGVNVAATLFHFSARPEIDGELCGGHPSHREQAMSR